MYHNTHDEELIKKAKSERLFISLVITPYITLFAIHRTIVPNDTKGTSYIDT